MVGTWRTRSCGHVVLTGAFCPRGCLPKRPRLRSGTVQRFASGRLRPCIVRQHYPVAVGPTRAGQGSDMRRFRVPRMRYRVPRYARTRPLTAGEVKLVLRGTAVVGVALLALVAWASMLPSPGEELARKRREEVASALEGLPTDCPRAVPRRSRSSTPSSARRRATGSRRRSRSPTSTYSGHACMRRCATSWRPSAPRERSPTLRSSGSGHAPPTASNATAYGARHRLANPAHRRRGAPA